MARMETDEGIEPATQTFNLFLDKPLPSPVVNGEWHPDKDLLAMILEDGKVVLHRLNWDKLWTITPAQKPTSICWRPDGKVLAVGHDGGMISLHDAENGKTLSVNKSHNVAVKSLSWVEESTLDDQYDLFCYNDRTSRFFPPPPKAPYMSDTSISFSEHVDEQDTKDQELVNSTRGRLNILCSGDRDGTISFSIFGVFPIAKIDIREMPVCQSRPMGITFRVGDASLYKVALTKDLCKLVVLIYGTSQSSNTNHGFYSLIIDTSVFQQRHKELYQVALQASHIEELQNVFRSSLKTMYKQWSDCMGTFKDKLQLLSNLLADHGSNLSVQDELVNLLCGTPPSTGLRQFLENTLNEGGLKRLSKAIESAGKEMYAIIGERLQPGAELLAFRVGELKGLCEWHSHLKSIGLDKELIDQTMEEVGMLAVQIERFLIILSETLYEFQNFFSWLLKTLKMLNSETSSQTDQGPLIHSELVMVFLMTVFDQDLISCHLSGSEDKSSVKVGRDATKRLEELVMFGGFKDTKFLQRTFYQQYQQFEGSCKESFSIPFKTVSGKLCCEDIILLCNGPSVPKLRSYGDHFSLSCYEDYICFKLPKESPDHSIIVIVRGLAGTIKGQCSDSSKKVFEVAAVSFSNSFQCIDVSLYKDNQLVVLFDEALSDDSLADSLLILLPLGRLPFLPVYATSTDCSIYEKFYRKSGNIEITIEDGNAHRITHCAVPPLLVSASRGLSCVFTSQRRAMVYIMEEEEVEEDGEDDR